MNPDKNFPRRTLTGLLAALSLLGVPMADALAASLTYNLNQSNVESSYADGVTYLQVEITSTSAGTANFNVTPVYAFATDSNYGLQSFAFNYSGSASSLTFSNLADGWSVNGPPASALDGFGKFEYIVEGNGNNRQAPLTFTVSGLGGDTTAQTLNYFSELSSGNSGQGNQFFAAHLAGFSDLSVGSGDFAGSTLAPVPEPETYAMLLAGLGLMGALARRRRIA